MVNVTIVSLGGAGVGGGGGGVGVEWGSKIPTYLKIVNSSILNTWDCLETEYNISKNGFSGFWGCPTGIFVNDRLMTWAFTARAARGVWGHAPPENYEMLMLWNAIYSVLREHFQSKMFGKSIAILCLFSILVRKHFSRKGLWILGIFGTSMQIEVDSRTKTQEIFFPKFWQPLKATQIERTVPMYAIRIDTKH